MTRVQFTPMLAAKKPHDFTDEMFLSRIQFPVGATPKFDGIRCVLVENPQYDWHKKDGDPCRPVCRSLKTVPNYHIREMLSKLPPGPDGELVTYDKDGKMRPFNRVQSDVMSMTGTPIFKYHVFDWADFQHRTQHECEQDNVGYLERTYRIAHDASLERHDFIVPCLPIICKDRDELLAYEEQCLEEGYEGVCFRTLKSKYKFGRSTLNEGYLVALKRFVTEEARVINTMCQYTNNNPAALDERGYTERSSHKANMTETEMLGALVVQNARGEFKIGIGFTDQMKHDYWRDRKSLIGKIVTFKHQPYGAKDLPRIPVFVGFRDPIDTDPLTVKQFRLL